MLTELDDVINAFSESAVQKITETVKGIISSYSIYLIREWELEYNDNDYYLDANRSLGFVLGKDRAVQICDDLLMRAYEGLKDERWRYVDSDKNYNRREIIAAKLASADERWNVPLKEIKEHEYMPPLYDFLPLEPFE
jgi:hypothetical protein